MESRNDWFDILLDGLSPEEQEHALQVIAASDARKADKIRRQNAREVKRLQERQLLRAESPPE